MDNGGHFRGGRLVQQSCSPDNIVRYLSLNKKPADHLFIAGCGDIGLRLAELWSSARACHHGLVRSPESARRLAQAGIMPIVADLDQPLADGPLAVAAQDALLFYFIPPPAGGLQDTRLQTFLRDLDECGPPAVFVYISTSGVYGDCQGRWITEETLVNPGTPRARRRLAAERQLLDWQQRSGVPLVILRVGGIYGPGRMPCARIRQGAPVLTIREAPYSNRIHAYDLARICQAAAQRACGVHLYNVSDGRPCKMTTYFYRLADKLGIARPPVVSWQMAGDVLSPVMMSYLRESRRLSNRRMLTELGISLRYPGLRTGLQHCGL